MNDAALARVHGIEAEGLVARFDAFGRGDGRQAQLFDAEHAVIVGIEGDAGVIFRRNAQGFLSELFESEQDLCFIREQSVDVFAGKLDTDIGIFEFRVRCFVVDEFVGDLQPGERQDVVQERAYAVAVLRNVIFQAH